VARPAGFEPATWWSEATRSDPLSYGRAPNDCREGASFSARLMLDAHMRAMDHPRMTLTASPRRSRVSRVTEERPAIEDRRLDDAAQSGAEIDAAPPVFSGGPLFLDLDTVLLAQHPGRYGVELGLQADLEAGIKRLRQVGGRVVVLVDPAPVERRNALATPRRLATLQAGLGEALSGLIVVACPHDDGAECQCAKPSAGLIELALRRHHLESHDGWYIGGDQAGVQAGRAAGLRTIRIGPAGEDHLASVHRPDYEARDLLDAANHIMLEALPLR
jgi:histidinol phosphatase-like enzyme